MAMIYEVTYQLGGQERTDRVDAPDAAGAAASVKDAYARSEDRFELLLVHLIEDQTDPAAPPLDVGGLVVGS
jgi:hypothetical protein